MNRSELIDQLADRFPALTLSDTTAVVSVILDAITARLAAGERIEIRGFGAFSLNSRPPRIGRNPKTGETVQVPAKMAVHFKPGKELRAKVNPPPLHHRAPGGEETAPTGLETVQHFATANST